MIIPYHKGIIFGKAELYSGHRILTVFYRNVSEIHCRLPDHINRKKQNSNSMLNMSLKSLIYAACFDTVSFFKTCQNLGFSPGVK